jgi:hypothetical protein
VVTIAGSAVGTAATARLMAQIAHQGFFGQQPLDPESGCSAANRISSKPC